MNYANILCASNTDDLLRQIRDAMNDRERPWKPQGGPFVDPMQERGQIRFMQLMVRDEGTRRAPGLPPCPASGPTLVPIMRRA